MEIRPWFFWVVAGVAVLALVFSLTFSGDVNYISMFGGFCLWGDYCVDVSGGVGDVQVQNVSLNAGDVSYLDIRG